MGIFKRISDIISANLGDLADRYENPEKMLKQAIAEMEETIKKSTSETAKTLANEKRLAKELAHNESEGRRWQERAEQAVRSGDDELARRALARKKEHESLAIALKDQLRAVNEATQTLRHQLEGMKAKLAEARRNLATLTARQKAAEVRQKAYLESQDAKEIGLDNEAFKKFERLREKVEMAEATAEALSELRADESGRRLDDRADDTGDDVHIEDELRRLKEAQRG